MATFSSICKEHQKGTRYMATCALVQDVILMSDSCDVCGYKSSEVKGGGAISDLGRLITVQVTEQEDLRRDVIKADSATVSLTC
jgi:zinc finger protein